MNATSGPAMHPGIGCLLVILTAQERADFLPGDSVTRLERLGRRCVCIDPAGLDTNGLATLLERHEPEVLVACWKTPPLPERLPPSLRYLCYLAGSVRRIVTRKQIEDGLLVTNWGASISRTVAECALLMILSCLRQASAWTLGMHLRGAWKTPETKTWSLFDRRVGLHGYGRISQCLAELMRPFNVRVSAFSPSVPDGLLAEHGVTRAPSLEALFGGSEIIVELAALTPRSRHMVREEHLRLIPEPGVFVNVGRGALVEPDGLLRVAREGRLQIALDVFETEPLPPDSPLRGLANVMLLPHLGGPTYDRRRDAGAHALENLSSHASGGTPESVVTPQVYDTST